MSSLLEIGVRAAVLSLWAAVAVAQTPPDESRAMAALWKQHADRPDQHAGWSAALATYEQTFPRGVYLPVARGVSAWHMARAGQTNDARQAWQRMLEDPARGPVNTAGVEIAKTWLTRLDALQVREAIMGHYRKQVAFPLTLGAVTNTGWPATDRWGRPWGYKLQPMRQLKRLRTQKYDLHSPSLGADPAFTDWTGMLQRPYGAIQEDVRVSRLLSVGGQVAVQFQRGTESPVVSVGARIPGTDMVLLEAGVLVVIGDKDYFTIYPRPDAR